MKKITYNQLSSLTGMAYRTIKSRIEEAGIEPIVEGNKHLFNSIEVLPVLFGKINSVDSTNYRDELEKEKWRKEKRENDLAEKKLAPIQFLGECLTDVLRQQAAIFDNIPGEIKRNLPQLPHKGIEIIKREVAKARNLAADVNVSRELQKKYENL